MTKNLLFIVLDSIRGDRTPFGGHNRQTMPRISELAPDVGTTCISHGIWSQPSMASLLTGTWPSHHGVGLHNEVLSDQLTTVAERLSAANYRTVGYSTNPYFSPETGLNRGFDECEFFGISDLFKKAGITGTASFLRYFRKYSAGLTLEKRKHSPDFLFNEVVKSKLKGLNSEGRPFAMVAHYHGAHHPYYPSPYFEDSVAGNHPPGEAAEFSYQVTKDPYDTIANNSLEESEWRAIRQTYDALVRQIDSLIRGLLEYIDALGLTEETIVVVTADHGDLLGEQDLMSHKLLLHDSLIEVPLIVWGSDRLVGVEDDLIQHIDVMQTILEEMGVPTDGMHGRPYPSDRREFTITQRGAKTAEKTLRLVREINPYYEHETVQRGLLTALRTKKWKLVRGEDRHELYELPDEETDRSKDEPERVQHLSENLDTWTDTFGKPIFTDERTDFSEEVRDHLSDLGYIIE